MEALPIYEILYTEAAIQDMEDDVILYSVYVPRAWICPLTWNQKKIVNERHPSEQ